MDTHKKYGVKGISVVICCFNSGTKIIPTLHHLAAQQHLPDVSYELIVVDNKCTDDTVEIALNEWNSAKRPYPLKVIEEVTPGLNHAREKGIKAACYDYIILCDDDNWLCDDYLARVFQIFEERPEVGLIGGAGEAITEIPAPEWFKELKGFGYAVGTEGRQTGYVESVYGAGMALRKKIFLSIMKEGFSFILTDRTGKNLSSGGDTEISMLVKNTGYKIYLDTSLTFKHFLNTSRLQWDYYIKLRQSFGRAMAYIQLYERTHNSFIPLQNSNRVKQFFSIAKFTLSNLKYLAFTNRFQNARCADFNQQLWMRLTWLKEQKKINTITLPAQKLVKQSSEV